MKNSFLKYTAAFLSWKASVFLVIAAALLLRLPALDLRPMHGDEAVQAYKFGKLLEDGEYRYDPTEYHGPTLYYATLIPAWLSSTNDFAGTNETLLRLVPVFFSMFLILLPLFIVKEIGKTAALVAMLLTAISPAMVFYSRYYIQEMLLVTFIFGMIVSGICYFRSAKPLWAAMAGINLALAYATKETFIIPVFALLLAIFLVNFQENRSFKSFFQKLANIPIKHWSAFSLSFLIISVLFFTSFFTYPRGLIDSILSYQVYLDRAVKNDWHLHPWYFYLEILLFYRVGDLSIWTEALILISGSVGIFTAIIKREMSAVIKILAYYTLISMILFSAIPYKTPWNMLCFLHGLIIMAGTGSIAIYQQLETGWLKKGFIVIFTVGCLHLGWQAHRANFELHAAVENPYVYGHPTKDIFRVRDQIEKVTAAHPDSELLSMQFIFPGGDYWPFPWYLRHYPNIRWEQAVNETIPPAPLIIASPSAEKGIIRLLYELPPPGERHLYVPLFEDYMELRPGMEIRGYVRQDVWEMY